MLLPVDYDKNGLLFRKQFHMMKSFTGYSLAKTLNTVFCFVLHIKHMYIYIYACLHIISDCKCKNKKS